MTHSDYHADIGSPVPSLSSSIANVLITRSPRHAWMQHPRLNPDYRPEEDSRFDLGTAAHALLLEGDDRMAVVEADDWRTKAAKEARDQHRAAGKLPVLLRHYAAVKAMVIEAHKAVLMNPDLDGYTLKNGTPEHVIRWHEGETHLRAMLDWISTDRRVIYDYKTTENAEPEAFLRLMFRMGYDLQGAFYLRAVQRPDTKFIFIAQEIEPPYAVSFVGMPPAMVELGTRKVEHALAIWRECMASGKWPAYPTRVLWPEVPVWVQAQWDEQEMGS